MDVQISLYLFSLFVFYQPNTNWVSVYLSLYCLFLSLYQCISHKTSVSAPNAAFTLFLVEP